MPQDVSLKTHFKNILFFMLAILLSSCGGGGSTTPPPDPPLSGETVSSYYSKGPVDGASCQLLSIAGDVVAGPVNSQQGNITFNNVSFTGEVYTECSGGSYTDEASGQTVQLGNSDSMRSAISQLNSNTNSLQQNVTPLTEIAFQRTENAGSLSATAMATQLAQVADEFGLDGIDLAQVSPTALNQISGNSTPAERYGTVLAGLSQLMLDSRTSGQATAQELNTLIQNLSTNSLDPTPYRQALNNLSNNPETSQLSDTSELQSNSGIIADNSQQASGTLRVTLISNAGKTPGTANRSVDAQLTSSILVNPNSLRTAIQDGNQISQDNIIEQADGSYLIHDVPVTSNASVNIGDNSAPVAASQTEISISNGEITDIQLLLTPTHTLNFNIQSDNLDSVNLDINSLGLRNETFDTNTANSINGLPEGRHFISFSDTSSGTILQSRYINIPNTQDPLNIDLSTHQNSLTGRILDSSGIAISGALLMIKPDSETYQLTQTTDNGQYSFNNLPTGTYSLIVNKTGYNSIQQQDITIVAGVNSHPDISLSETQSTGSIAGYVYFNDAQQHNGIDITLEKVGGGAGTNQSGSLRDGSFLTEPLEPGLYNLLFGKAADSEYSTVTLSNLEVVAGVTRVIEAPVILQHQIGQINGTLSIPADFGDTSNLKLELLDNNQQLVKSFVITDASVTSYQIEQIPVGTGYTLKLSGLDSETNIVREQISAAFDITAGAELTTDTIIVVLQVGSLSGTLDLPAGFGDLSNLNLIISNSNGDEISRKIPDSGLFTFAKVKTGTNYSLSISGVNFNGTAIKLVQQNGIEIQLGQTTELNQPLTIELQLSITEGDNQKPQIIPGIPDVTSAPIITLNYTVQDPEGDAITCRISWGDNTADTVVENCYNSAQTHTYADIGDYRIVLSASDNSGSVIWDQIVPVIYYPFLTGLNIIEQTDRVIELQGGVQNSLELNINWGDGSAIETLTQNLDNFSVLHQYATAGSYQLTLSNDTGVSVVRSLLISQNLAPVIVFDNSSNLKFNNMTLKFSVSDPEDDVFSCSVNWGDGQIEQITLCSVENLSHQYGTVGDYSISISATDVNNQTNQISVPARVTLLQQNTLSVDNLTLTSQSGLQALLTGSINVSAGFSQFTINWGDGQTASYTPSSPVDFTNLQLVKTFSVAAEYLVTLSILDQQGNFSGAQYSVLVADNYAPEIILNSQDIIKQDVTLDFSVSDRDLDQFSCDIIWGDGITQVYPTCNQVNTSHHYEATGLDAYNVVIRATDVNQNSAAISIDANINVIPEIQVNAIEQADQSVNLNGLVKDFDGTIASVIIDWGDSNIISLVLPETPVNQLAINETHRYDITGIKTIGLTLFDNEGAKSTRTYAIDVRVSGGTQADLTISGLDSISATVDYEVSLNAGSNTVYECLIVWGDGLFDSLNQCTAGSNSHTFAQGVAADYAIKFYISDDAGRHSVYVPDISGTKLVKTFIPDALPEIHIRALSTPTPARITISGYMLFADQATIDWGNQVSNTLNGGFFNIISNQDYQSNGPFTVTVTATNTNGTSQTDFTSLFDVLANVEGSHTVNAFDPMRLITVAAENLDLSVTATAGYSYHWSFDGLKNDAVTETPGPVLFDSAGIYFIRLDITDDQGQQGSLQWQVDVKADTQPLIDVFSISGTDSNGDPILVNSNNELELWQGESLSFTASVSQGNAPLVYQWDFKGAASNSTELDAGLVTLDQPGLYNISFSVTDLDGEITRQTQLIRIKSVIGGENGAAADSKKVFVPFPDKKVMMDEKSIFATPTNPIADKTVTFTYGSDETFDPLDVFQFQDVIFNTIESGDVLLTAWDMGDGNSILNVNTVSHSFDEIGQLTVSEVITYIDGTTETHSIIINTIADSVNRRIVTPDFSQRFVFTPTQGKASPTPDTIRVFSKFTYDRPTAGFYFPLDGTLNLGQFSLYTKQYVEFTAPVEADIGALSYEWDYGGVTTASSNFLTLQYSASGIYPLSLTVIYTDGSQKVYQLTVNVTDDIGIQTAPDVTTIKAMVPIEPTYSPVNKTVTTP